VPNLEYGEWIDTAALFLTVSGILLGFLYTQILQSEGDRRDLIDALHAGKVRCLYQSGAAWLLRSLHKLYGRAESFQAFSVSLLLAYLYPLLFFILAYSYFDGTNLFSGKELLPKQYSYYHYLIPFLLFISIMIFIFIHFFDSFLGSFSKKTNSWLEFSFKILISLIFSLLVWIYFDKNIIFSLGIFALAYIGMIPAILFLALILTSYWVTKIGFDIKSEIFSGFWGLVFLYALLIKTKIKVVFLASISYVIWSIGENIYHKNYISSFIQIFFYILLPSVNALLDWLSWWVSRFFLEKTAQLGVTVLVIVRDVVLDFGVAVLFMLALCLLLPAGAIALDSLYVDWIDTKAGVHAQTGWQEYAMLARDDPWGKGIMVTLMLVTTLIPTLLHIVMGLMAFFIHSFKGAALATFLEQPRKNWRDTTASLWIYGYFMMALLTLLMLWQLFQHLAHLQIAHWLYDFTGYFYDFP